MGLFEDKAKRVAISLASLQWGWYEDRTVTDMSVISS